MIAHKLLALYAAAFFALSSVSFAGAQTSGATTTVNSFYRWYFANKTDWTRLAGARAYLTPSLYSLLQHVADVQKREGEVLDFDPFVGAQERARSYELLEPSGSGTRMSVPVRFGLEHSSARSELRAIVVNGSGGWKIDNFIYPGVGDLRSTIAKALK